jgi:hypothetical protein
MIHAAIAVAVQLLLMFAGIDPWLAGLAPVAFYFGREMAQAEHRTIQNRFGNRRANAPWYVGFIPHGWTRDTVLDATLPVIAVAAVAALAPSAILMVS